MTALIPLEGATATALTLPARLPYEEWARTGHALGRMGKAVQFWLGDWMLYGEAEYGEEFAQAVTETGYSEESLRGFLWVSSRIPPEVRRITLSWSHHQIVASSDDPKTWLDTCEAQQWSVRELRDAVKGPKKPKAICGYPDCPMKENQ